jgi:hypothetical protein
VEDSFLRFTEALSRRLGVQATRGGKVIIVGGHSIGHSKQKSVYVHVSCIPNGFRDRARISLYSTDEQHAMSSHELQSALILTVEFSKMYYTNFVT